MTMNKTTIRAVFALLALSYVLSHFIGHAHAQSSLGIGASEATLPSTGLFAGVFNWVNAQQQSFYRALSGAMRGMRDGNGGAWLLAGLLRLWHLSRRRARPRQGGDLVLHAGQ
jgi:hypothetical protein